jgi:hypothetical protein
LVPSEVTDDGIVIDVKEVPERPLSAIRRSPSGSVIEVIPEKWKASVSMVSIVLGRLTLVRP